MNPIQEYSPQPCIHEPKPWRKKFGASKRLFLLPLQHPLHVLGQRHLLQKANAFPVIELGGLLQERSLKHIFVELRRKESNPSVTVMNLIAHLIQKCHDSKLSILVYTV